jgi:hypothetical protein
VPILSDGTYTFSGLRALGLSVKEKNKLSVPSLVEVNGCNTSFARILTSTDKQDITWGSTVVSYAANSSSAARAAAASSEKLESLYSSLSAYNTFANAFSAIQSSSLLTSDLQDALGIAPASLQDASPRLLSVTVPANLREGETSALSLQTTQWDSNYNYAFEWRMDGIPFSSAAATTFLPKGNTQGAHVIMVLWGQQDGSGHVNQAKPFQSRSFNVLVENTMLPAAPPLGAVSNSVNVPTVQLRIQTGTGLANCDTFSSLAITEDMPVAPMVPSAYNISCSTAPVQSVSYALAGGIGSHNLYLWAMDAAGAISATPSVLAVTYSLIVPNVTITSPAANFPAQNSVIVSGACDVSAGDVSLSGDLSPASSLASCAGGTFSRSVALSSGDGAKQITASQTNQFNTTGSASVTIQKDTAAPTVALSSLTPPTTNAASFVVNVNFSEPVSGFNISKISATNGSVSALTGTGAAYSFTLTPSAQGAVSATVAANAGMDAAGNANASSATLARIFDTVSPTVVIASSASSPTNLSSIPVTVAFSEPVTGFSLSSLLVTNATASGLSGSGASYSFNLLPSGQGLASVTIAANAAQDAGGNGNSASNSVSKVFDSIAPTLTLSSSASDPTNTTPIPVTATFSEAVTGFSVGSISVTNGSASAPVGSGTSYTFNVTPSGNGPVTINVASAAAQDTAGNSSGSASLSRSFNNVHPSVTVASVRTSPTNNAPFPITVTFSSSVTGFTSAGVTVTNGTISAFTGSGTAYSFSVAPTSQGAVSVAVNAGAAQDSASNANLASNTLSLTFDTIAPTLAITAPTNGSYVNLSNQSNLSLTGTCSEEGRTLNFTAGAATASATCSAGAFSAIMDLSALADGAVSLSASLTDAAGNSSSASVSLSKDTSAPTINFSGTPPSPSNSGALAVALSGAGVTHYKFKVGDAASTDCTLSAGYSSETAVATGISASISAQADGALILCAVGRNAAGNYQPLSSATSYSWVKDTAVTAFTGLGIAPASPGKNNRPSVSGLSESLASVALYGQASCGGPAIATASANAGGSFTLTPSAAVGADGNYSFTVKATDAAGNQLCSSSVPYLLDTIPPTVVIASTSPSSTNSSPIPVSLAFSESVTGLSSAGISVTNGAVAALTGSGANYTFNVIPTGQGAVTVAVAANAASDSAGNGNSASLTLSRDFDTAAPTITIASPVESASFKTTAVTASGACETGLSIAISGSGITGPASTMCTASAYSVALNLTSSDGVKNFTLTQTDAAGNVGTVTRAVNLDTVAPVFTFTSVAVQNQITKTNFITFTGTCETGLSIVVSGTDSGTIPCAGSAWSYTTANQNTEATRSYTFRQTDAATNATTLIGSWVRDTTAPALTIASPAANFSAKDSITLTGTCENGIPVVAAGSGLLSTVNITCSSGSYSQLVYFSPGDGTKAVTVTQTDAATNATTVSRNFVRDTTPPPITQALRISPYYSNLDSVSFGGACETGITIVVSGTDSTSIPCSSSAWSYTTLSQTTDASRTYTFTQIDAAGNIGQISSTWSRDTVAPLLTFSSASAFVTSGDSVNFGGNCEAGLFISVSGSGSATIPCNAGSWAYLAGKTLDGNYSYTFSENDLAGNSSSLTGTWNRSTSGPVITVTQISPQITNSGSIAISGTCSGGTAGSNGIITVGGAGSGSITCPSTTSTAANWNTTLSQGSDGTYNYTFSITDNFSTPRTSSAVFTWQRDTAIPVLAAGAFTIKGGQSTTAVSFNPVAFTASDNLSTILKFCLKTSSAPPASNDGCWTAISNAGVTPSNSIAVTNYSFNIGILPQTYTYYLWVMDGAGNISSNSAMAAKDMATISLTPIAPPAVTTVLASNSDIMNGAAAERIISAGSDVFIRWTASGSSLSATPVSLFFTTDDKTWTSIASGLANGQNNCSSIQGSGTASATATGCYRWSSGSPTNNYYRVRVSVANSVGGTTFANSGILNANRLQVLAGNTEAGINGSAASGIFLNAIANGLTDSPSLAVANDGTIYFRDINQGIMYVKPVDGVLRSLITSGATTSGFGDGGPVSSAKLRMPSIMVIDYQGRLLVFDYDRIRRIDLSQNPPTISTLIGGGASTADSIPLAKDLSVSSYSSFSSGGMPALKILPNGNIYFQSEAYGNNYKRFRLYTASTGSISSIYPVGPSTPISYGYSDYSISDVTKCSANRLDMAFDPNTSAVSTFMVMFDTVRSTSAGACAIAPTAGGNITPTYLMDSTGQASPTYPTNYGNWVAAKSSTSVDAHDGNIYRVDLAGGAIKKYNVGANTWTTLVGTGTQGSCADGTAALSCAIAPMTAFVDASGLLYFVDGGRIRTLLNGTVTTLYGQPFGFGDGGLATNSRFNLLTSVAKRSDSTFLALDSSDFKVRSFTEGGNITIFAGNGKNSSPNTTSAANAQPIPIAGNYVLTLDNSDNLYFGINGAIYSLSSAANAKWTLFAGGGGTAYYNAAANGAIGTSVSISGSVTPLVLGFNGSSILYSQYYFSGTTNQYGIYGEFTLTSPPVHNWGLGPVSAGLPGNICSEPSSRAACNVPGQNLANYSSYGNNLAAMDSTTGRWLLMDNNGYSVRSYSQSDINVSTTTTLANRARSITFSYQGSRRYLYYCSSDDGLIHVRNIDTSTEAIVSMPVASILCSGKSIIYEPGTGSVVFPFQQNGLSGVARLLGVDAATLGL